MASKYVAGEPKTDDCPVCKESLQNPRRLPCGHQICTDCLQQLTSASAKTETLHCPSCSSEWTLPEKGVADLPTVKQFTEKGQTAADQKVKFEAEAVLCSNREDGPATVFCTDCNEFYCEECASGHRRIKAMRGHNTRPVDKMSPDDIVQAQSTETKKTCSEHEQPFNIQCQTCDKVICAICAMFKHKNHNLQELVEAADDAQKMLKDTVFETTDYVTKQQCFRSEMGQTKEYICTSVKAAKANVKKAAKRMRDTIDSHEQDLLRDLDRHETESLNKLESIVKESENNETAVLTLKRETESLVKSGKPINQVERTLAIREQLDARKKSEQQNMTWRYVLEQTQQREKSLKAMLGSIKLSSLHVIKPGGNTLGEYVIQVRLKYKGTKVVTGMVVIGDCLCITHDGDPHLWLYDMVSGRNKTCPVPGLQNPQGMALLNSFDGTVVITNCSSDSGKLHFVRISTSLDISVIRVKNIPVKVPWRISVCRETGELLIGQWGTQFVICNEEGDVQRQVTVTSPDRRTRWPFCVTRTKDRYLVLMWHVGECIIQYLDQDGNCTHTYGCNDGEQMKYTCQMVTDNEGRLIVTDWDNYRLRLVDTSGHLSQFLLTEDDGTRQPNCVFLDEAASRLYVTHGKMGSQEVRVYRWPPISGDTKTTNFELELNLGQF